MLLINLLYGENNTVSFCKGNNRVYCPTEQNTAGCINQLVQDKNIKI